MKKLFAALALFALSSMAFAASTTKGDTNDADAYAVGIITPNVANSAVVVHNYIRFRDTGEFGICADGHVNSECEIGKYLTPEQFVAKFYPKSKYIGFRLLMGSTNSYVSHLYLYIKKVPQ